MTASPTNEAKELHELMLELKLPIAAVIEYGLGVTTTAFYAWRDRAVLMPQDRREQMRDLVDTLKHYRDKGILPADKNELIWEGLVALSERKG